MVELNDDNIPYLARKPSSVLERPVELGMMLEAATRMVDNFNEEENYGNDGRVYEYVLAEDMRRFIKALDRLRST